MKLYKFPKWTKRIYPDAIWDFYFKEEKALYLSFDDGPNPTSTQWILDLLDKHNIKATFFCLGKNVVKNPGLFQSLIDNGHTLGNHSMTHPNGLKTESKIYAEDVIKAQELIPSKLFRPPYGKIKPAQYKALKEQGFKMVFWSIMSYDFDNTISSEDRLKNIRKNIKPGSVIVFHDSEKAFPQLEQELPLLMEEWIKEGYEFKLIS